MSCIQMKLDEAVNDESLRKLDEFILHVQAPESNRILEIHAYGAEAQTMNVRVVGDGVLYTDDTFTEELGKTTILSGPNNWRLYLGAGDYDIYIDNKYKLTDFESLPSGNYFRDNVSVDCKYLQKLTNWTNLDLNGVRLYNFEKFAIDKLYGVRLYNCKISVDVSLFVEKLSEAVILEKFILSNDETITGDATELGNSKAFLLMDNHAVISVRPYVAGQNLTGTYDEFCDKLFALGKTSGTIKVHMPEDPEEDEPYSVTFNSEGWVRS